MDTDPRVARLRQAAVLLRYTIADATPGLRIVHERDNELHVEAAPDGPHIALIGRSYWPGAAGDAAWGALMHTGIGEALAAVFDKWARMGEYDAAQLHRVGGAETVALADEVLRSLG